MTSPTDVLIVGAGSAGSVLAERLSEDPSQRVTVLEAGPDRRDSVIRTLTDNPTVLPIGPDSPVIRRYRTALTATQSADIVRGSVVGGSGAVNGGYYWRAQPADFDGWPPGWSWSEIEPHYRAVEALIPARPQARFALATAVFAAAAAAAGFGVDPVPLNIADDVRLGPGAAFLEPSLGRPNLTVRAGTRVTRLRIGGGRVTGVEAVGPGGTCRIDADRVVLSAGAVESAHLLMLSGVGPAEALDALGIAVVADLPVGVRCQDHPEWVMATGWPAEDDHPVLEAVLSTESCEIRPYTTGFGADVTSIGVALMRPRSYGRLSLESSDPAVQPRIEHRYDSAPADIDELQRGCDLVAEILREATTLGAPVLSTSQHLCGTAPMGTGPRAVVDARCQVLGIAGLHVIDGSVLPTIPSRGPHATIAMLAHRAAEFF